MPVEIEENSLCLSGETGTKLKTQIIERYYSFWLSVTTRGRGRFADKVHIVEMNAGTGQVKIEETGEIILGSAGHALELKYGPKRLLNKKLRIVLIEPHEECRTSLQSVISNRWPEAVLQSHRKGWKRSKDGCVNLFDSVKDFIRNVDLANLGTSLFFFDPLLAPNQSVIDFIAGIRIDTPFKIGTEFLIFFFTSDWVNGRDEFSALPRLKKEKEWTSDELESAKTADSVFGSRDWVEIMSRKQESSDIQRKLVQLYKKSLRKWFRYVQPLQFVPKKGQRYDLFCCSNFDVGMTVINRIYGNLTWPFGLQAKNPRVYPKFIQFHPELLVGLISTQKPPEWKVLWQILKNHIDGICDLQCRGEVRRVAEKHPANFEDILTWLDRQGYIKPIDVEVWPWSKPQFPVFSVDWDIVKSKLDVDSPIPPRALEPGDLEKVRAQPQEQEEDDDQTSLADFF